jgi:hypothetical protein
MTVRFERWGKRAMSTLCRVVLPLLCFAAACRAQGRDDASLRVMVDSLLPKLEQISGLEAREPVRVSRRTREELRRFVERRLAEELPPAELEGVVATYRALGLLPETLELDSLLLELYAEQVVGYYDPKTKALYVIEGVAPRALAPVLAHELVHALQDQHVDLDSLIARERGNDRQMAAQAAIEGHATLVMLLLAQALAGRPADEASLPDLDLELGLAAEAQSAQFPVFGSAPRIIRETMLFPYIVGARFVQVAWRREGRPPAFERLIPASTEQVLHPETRFVGQRDTPMEVSFEGSPASPWRVVYENTLGELETSILLSEHLGGEAAVMAEGWDGDRYRLLEAPGGGRVLIWYSVWDSEAAADSFANGYRQILARRPGRRGRVERVELDGRPGVRVVDAEVGVDPGAVPAFAVRVEEAAG